MLKIDQQISEYKRKIQILERKKEVVNNKVSEEKIELLTSTMADRIKVTRENCGLLQSELAKIVGCSRTSISNIERGSHIPSVPLLLKIVTALNCKITDIVSEQDLVS